MPGGPHTTNFDNFDNENANGTWRLYSYRTCFGGCPASGDRIESWSLDISTGSIDLDLPAGGAGVTSGIAGPYPSTRTITDRSGIVTDLNVRVDGIFHNHPGDIDMMLEKVGGPKVMLMSDSCGSYDVNAYGWVWDDEAPAAMPAGDGTDVCGTTSHRPTDRSPGESLPGPAPPAPYSTSLSAFDLGGANGIYRLWVADDASGDEGFFTSQFSLSFVTRPLAPTSFTQSAIEIAEDGTGTLTVRRSGASAYAPGAVDVRSAPGTAGPGDFTPVNESVTFAADETEKTVEIEALADELAEGAETFTLTISGPSGDAAVGSPSTSTVTIPANEAPPPPPAPAPAGEPPADPPPEDPPVDTGGGDQVTLLDTLAPQTAIAKAPKRRTPRPRAKVAFTSSEPGSSFECSLDRGAFRTCAPPARLRRLRPGRHRFAVLAVDAAGNADATPARVRWKVLP